MKAEEMKSGAERRDITADFHIPVNIPDGGSTRRRNGTD